MRDTGPDHGATEHQNPLTLSTEELIEALTTSGGYIAFAYIGMGQSQFIAWRPETGQFEVLTHTRRPRLADGVVVIEPQVTDHYGMDEAGLRDWLPEHPTAPSESALHPITYEDTPFTDAGHPEETWEADPARLEVTG